jgi:hypothetical protein
MHLWPMSLERPAEDDHAHRRVLATRLPQPHHPATSLNPGVPNCQICARIALSLLD